MYNAMNTIAPRPYVARNGQSYRTEEESSEQTQDSLQQGGRQHQGNQQQQNQQEPRTIARGRATDVATPPQRRPLTAHRGARPVQMGARPQTAQPQQQTVGNPQGAPLQTRPTMMPAKNIQPQQRPQPQQQANAQPVIEEPSQEQISRMAKNNKINIAQVIKDFRGTYAAIGTPQCLVDEVESYLVDIIEHTKGEAPSINYVQTNLQNAAVIIDKYISQTLEKESKVVQNWLDALFLQRINYRYNEGEVNQDFLVKFPEGNTPQQSDNVVQAEPVKEEVVEVQTEIPDYVPEPVNVTAPVKPVPVQRPKPVQQRVVQPQQVQPVKKRKKVKITVIPEDNEIKAMFVQAKKHAFLNNPAKAMNIFGKALLRAEAINDTEALSKICFEMGKIYDDNNYLAQALSSYNKSLKDTTDTSIKTKAHYSMAKIYDDVNQVNSAINHYLTSVSYAGEEDDLSSQSQSLTNIANIYTDKYDTNAFVFYDEANSLVVQTDDFDMRGYVSSNTAGALNKFNKPEKALKCYADAVKNYSEAKSSNSVAENYKAAGELMYDLKNPAKAKILLKKALSHTNQFRDKELINEIKDLLEEIG